LHIRIKTLVGVEMAELQGVPLLVMVPLLVHSRRRLREQEWDHLHMDNMILR
jgi:hypothetical protein